MSEMQILFPKAEQADYVPCERSANPLGATEISGKTLYTLISNGTELNVYVGNYVKEGLTWGQFPFVPGYACAFVVDAVGADVKDIKAGDTCFCVGLHRSFQRVERAAVLPVPAGMDPTLVPFARLMNVTMSTLTTTTARPPARVVVTGLGPIGVLGALMFKRCGYRVTGVDPTAARREAAQRLGLDDVRAAVPTDDPALAGKVSLVLECSAHEQAVLDGLGVLEKRGELVQVGVPMARKTEIYAQQILNKMFRTMAVIRSGSEWEVPKYPTDYRKNSNFGNMAAALEWLHEGSVSVAELFMIAPPDAPQQLYQDLLHQRTAKPAVVLDWTA